MYLKRKYGENLQVNGVKVLRSHKIEHLSPNIIERGVSQGWLTMGGGRVIVHGSDGDVVFQLVRYPGYYCCHCDTTLEDSSAAVAHLKAAHKDVPSPDPSNPEGYRCDNFFTCVSDKAVENMTPEAGARLDKQVRDALYAKLSNQNIEGRK
jgi:hypothetical protein